MTSSEKLVYRDPSDEDEACWGGEELTCISWKVRPLGLFSNIEYSIEDVFISLQQTCEDSQAISESETA